MEQLLVSIGPLVQIVKLFLPKKAERTWMVPKVQVKFPLGPPQMLNTVVVLRSG